MSKDTKIEINLAEEGTVMADFQKERTDAITQMFDSKDEYGLYQTSRFFARLDNAVEKAITSKLLQIKEECGGLKKEAGDTDIVCDNESCTAVDAHNQTITDIIKILNNHTKQ